MGWRQTNAEVVRPEGDDVDAYGLTTDRSGGEFDGDTETRELRPFAPSPKVRTSSA